MVDEQFECCCITESQKIFAKTVKTARSEMKNIRGPFS